MKNYRSAKSMSGSDDVDVIIIDFIIMTTIPELIPIKWCSLTNWWGGLKMKKKNLFFLLNRPPEKVMLRKMSLTSISFPCACFLTSLTTSPFFSGNARQSRTSLQTEGKASHDYQFRIRGKQTLINTKDTDWEIRKKSVSKTEDLTWFCYCLSHFLWSTSFGF